MAEGSTKPEPCFDTKLGCFTLVNNLQLMLNVKLNDMKDPNNPNNMTASRLIQSVWCEQSKAGISERVSE
jgi:hypothetical protein